MWITAVFGMALKFSEATLAVHYRKINADGSASGGPMYYILHGLGARWKWLAAAFAFFAVISSFGQGNMIQSFTVTDQFQSEFGIQRWLTGLVMALLVGAVIIGGIKRIGSVAGRLTPFMALFYFSGALLILLLHLSELPGALATIVSSALHPAAQVSGVAGGGLLVFLNTMLWGVKRGLFSNEAGERGNIPHRYARSNPLARLFGWARNKKSCSSEYP
jgi:AGCS family alanine or glycine:cation symporter